MTQERTLEAVPEGHPIVRRKVRFDWAQTAPHWVPDDPFATHVINVLHLLLPAGERHFVSVVSEAQPQIDDSELLASITPFVQQEAWHAWAHSVVLDHLAEQGIDTSDYTDKLEEMFAKMLSAHPRWPRPLRQWWLRRRLAGVAALEHWTCVLGQWVLDNDGLDRAGADPTMLDLLRWHGAEEVEHRSLVYDCYYAVGGRYVQRITTFVEATIGLAAWWIAGIRYFYAHDPRLAGRKPRIVRDWVRAARQGRLPGLKVFLGTPPRYLRPGHHPSSEGSTEAALAYIRTSPAAKAAGAV